MIISTEGTCVQWNECMPTRGNPIWRGRQVKEFQKTFINKYNVFMSGGRVYVKLEKHIVDAVTGTLYWLNGHCINSEAGLFVDINDITTRCKKQILKFVWGKY